MKNNQKEIPANKPTVYLKEHMKTFLSVRTNLWDFKSHILEGYSLKCNKILHILSQKTIHILSQKTSRWFKVTEGYKNTSVSL